MKKLVLFLFLLVTISSQAIIITVVNKTDAPITLSCNKYGELITVDPGFTGEFSGLVETMPITFSQPFDGSLGFAPTTVAWVNWTSDYIFTVTRAKHWSDPEKLLRVYSRAVEIEYVTVSNSTFENIAVVDVNTHKVYGIVYGLNDEEHDHFTTFRFMNKVNLMFRQRFNPTLHRFPTGHVRIPKHGLWNVEVSQPAGFNFHGDVLKTELTPQE